MNILYKITFKDIAKFSTMIFIFAIFPLITLMFFYDPVKSLLGLLFSYVGLIGTASIIYTLFFFKNQFSKLVGLISNKLNSISDEKTYRAIKYTIIGACIILAILFLYFVFSIGSLLISLISFASSLNPLMIIALNIYYVGMSLSYIEYSKNKED